MQERQDHWRGVFGFYLAAGLMLFWYLGVNPLWASEDRWAEIARNMWQTGDWFHPAINGVVYFDKPLLSYWPIAFLALLCGFINEFLVRAPSALAALGALWATRDLAGRTAGEQAKDYAGWLLLSSYGFLFWGRTAAADMLNLTVVILAVDWFFRRQDKAGFGSYFVFYLICFAGALAKGLPALVLPLLVVAIRVGADGSWRRHLKWSHFLAVFPALLIALASFIAAAVLPMVDWYLQPEHGLSGLELVWRENIVRVFQPFDHKDEGWYAYFGHVPRIMAPWSLAVLGALAAGIASWRGLDREQRWLWLSALAIFVLFSLSGSRRWYYILPIMPFLSIVTARWMAESGRWNGRFLPVYRWGLLALAALGLAGGAGCVIWMLATGRINMIPHRVGVLPAVLYFILLAAVPPLLLRRREWRGVLWSGALLMAVLFSVLMPAVCSNRTEKPFALGLRQDLDGVPAERMIFFIKDAPKVVYYMDLRRPVQVARDENALRGFLEQHRGETVYVIAENRARHLAALKKVLPAEIADRPWRKEAVLEPFEKANTRKLHCWQYPVPAR